MIEKLQKAKEIKFVVSEKPIHGFFSFSFKTNKILFDHSVTILSDSDFDKLKEYCVHFRDVYTEVVNRWRTENPNKRMCAVKLRRQARNILLNKNEVDCDYIYKILSDLKEKVDSMFTNINGNMRIKLEQPKVRAFTELDMIED